MKSEGSIEIDRPIEEVFRLTCDHVAEWSTIVVEDEVVEATPDGVGSTFRTVTVDHGKRMEFDGVITQLDPPRLHRSEMTGKAFDLDVEYSFEDLGDRTRVSQHTVVNPKGLTKVFFFLFGWAMNKASCDALDKEFQSLKSFCESQPEPSAGPASD